MLMKKLVPAAAVAACIAALPASASAAQPPNPVPQCVQTVVKNAPGAAVYIVTYTIDNGEPPFIGGPFLPC
jgi:hypothetical protein